MAMSNAAQHAHDEYVEIETLYGKQVVDKASLLNFPEGLAGFEELHEFKLFHEEGASTVYYLQSTEDPYIRFPMVPAEACNIDYRIELTDDEADTLAIETAEDILMLVTISDNPEQPQRGITANLMAPIIINAHTRVGLQKPLQQIRGGVVFEAR